MVYKMQRDLKGIVFGKLLVLESCGKGKDKHYYSKVRCECGKEYLVPDSELICGRRKGCRKCCKKTHGMTNTKLFNIWQSMKQRCNDKNSDKYCFYGERNIKVCDEWMNNFMNFYNWAINNGYKNTLTIDRIDVNGNYEPSNCRWVDMKTQANNKRNNRFVDYKGQKYTIAELSEKFNINYSCLFYRIQNGWDIEKAVSTKPKKGRNQYEKI